ncbi:MAG: TetR/AcrR family transcriptional regulator, partial [Bacteroidota bacterium]
MVKNKAIWVEAGYAVFGREGINGLNVEQLAKKLNKNKSSFYHYFGDMETFVESLLQYHLERADQIAAKGAMCQSMDPDVINLLVETTDDLLFNKQLRLHPQHPAFTACFDEAFEKI